MNSEQAIGLRIQQHRAWLRKHADDVIEREQKELIDVIRNDPPNSLRHVATSLEMLGSCYGALGILRLLDDNASYTALLGQSIAYYDIYVALSRHLYRTQGLAPQLTMTDSVAAGLVCAGLVTENEHVAARAGEHLRFIEVEPEAVDSRYWSDRTYEPFAGRLLTFRNGDLPWETFVAESGGVGTGGEHAFDITAAPRRVVNVCGRMRALCDRLRPQTSGVVQSGSRLRAAEFMQKRSPVGPGPSGKTWPRWASQRAQRTSVRTMPWLVSVRVRTASRAMGSVKLGQPLPESYLVSLRKSSASHTMQR